MKQLQPLQFQSRNRVSSLFKFDYANEAYEPFIVSIS